MGITNGEIFPKCHFEVINVALREEQCVIPDSHYSEYAYSVCNLFARNISYFRIQKTKSTVEKPESYHKFRKDE